MTRTKKTRASHKKSKTGCRTCKIRRIKCDEQKPACQECISTSRTCDGYEDSREWVVVVCPPSSIPVSDGFEDDQGRRYFDFFRSQSTFELSRFFDSGIWGKLVLQAAYSSPAVRHAVIALASSHKEFKSRSMLTQREMARSRECTYGAQQYSKAVRHLFKQLSEKGQQGYAIALICGLLFIPFEVLRGNDIAALYHLEGCVKMLNETRSTIGLQGRLPTQASSAASENDVEQELLPIFARLDLEASLYMILRSPNLCLDYPEMSESDYPSPMFSSVLDASNCLNSIMNRTHRFIRSTGDHFRYRVIGDVPISVVSEQHSLLSQLSKWQCAFNSFLSHYQAPLPHHAAQEEKQINLLQIHHDVSTTTLACTLHAEELAYDAFSPMFARIVSLAEILHNMSNAEPKPHQQQQQQKKSPPATFSLETGIILPLYWTAIKCRDGRIRRQAVALLRTCQQEGVWIGEIQAEIAKRVIEIEEGELFDCATPQRVFKTSQDIPEWVRIHSVGMTLDKTRRKAKIACLQRLNGLDGEWDEREELVFW